MRVRREGEGGEVISQIEGVVKERDLRTPLSSVHTNKTFQE
jgi:hypothetical protein